MQTTAQKSQSKPGLPGRDPTSCYPMKQPYGYALIVNIKSFEGKTSNGVTLAARVGSDEDVKRLKKMWEELGFTVKTYVDLKAHEIYTKVYDIASDTDSLQTSSCFVCCIMSHGDMGLIYGSDCDFLNIENITDLFNKENCKPLTEKPKLFFIQACRGSQPLTGSLPSAQTPATSSTNVPTTGTGATNAAVQGTVSTNASVQGTVSTNAALQGTVLTNAALQGTSSTNAAVQGTVSTNAAVQGTGSTNAALQETSSTNAAVQETVSTNAAVQETGSTNAAAQGTVSTNAQTTGTGSTNSAVQGTFSTNAIVQGTGSDNEISAEAGDIDYDHVNAEAFRRSADPNEAHFLLGYSTVPGNEPFPY